MSCSLVFTTSYSVDISQTCLLSMRHSLLITRPGFPLLSRWLVSPLRRRTWRA